MLFFQSRKSAVVWDRKNDQPEFEFVNRFLTVDDPKKIERLKELGYVEVPDGAVSVQLPPRDGETPQVVEMLPGVSLAVTRSSSKAARIEK